MDVKSLLSDFSAPLAMSTLILNRFTVDQELSEYGLVYGSKR